MITAKMQRFIEEVDRAYVASVDERERPHLAVGEGLRVPAPRQVVFEAWFCRKTLENVAANRQVALAVVDPASGAGYQLAGRVTETTAVGILDGYAPEIEAPGTPQIKSRLAVEVDAIMEFSHASHSDTPLAAEV